MFGKFFKRLLFVIFLLVEIPLLFLFFSPELESTAIAIVMFIIFVLYIALNWIFSSFDK